MRNFERYCKNYKNIENYDKAAADNFKGWCCHHRLETWTSDGDKRAVDITAAELKALGMYYGRPASELIFMTRSEHISLHQKGKQPSEEHRKKLSEVHKGKHPSAETRNKMSEVHKGKHFSEEHKKKIGAAKKGKHHSEETKKKISEAKKVNNNIRGTRWYNDGKINIRSNECPEGFTPGRLLI